MGPHDPVVGAGRLRAVLHAVSLVLGSTGGRRVGLEPWTVALFGLTWLGRAAGIVAVDAALGLASTVPIWLLPLRDILSVTVILASYGGTEVAWRGHVLHISPPRLAAGKG